MFIMKLFHDLGYHCLKHFYIEKVHGYMYQLFTRSVAHNRFKMRRASCWLCSSRKYFGINV